jgi:hypothetical protein
MNDLNEMSCAEFGDVAAELALGVLTGRERAEALAHLDHCEACREHVRQLTMTGEGLLGLLPSREPPAGFETRVMDRLGLTVPERRPAGHRSAGRIGPISRLAGRLRGRPERQSDDLGTVRPSGLWLAARPRRLVAAAAVALALVASGLGGWGLHGATSPATASSPLSSAALLSARHQAVGQIFYYDGTPAWIYMSVTMDAGSGIVICQLKSADGHVTTIGSFRLKDGYGTWGSPTSVSQGEPVAARLLAADGTVLATATLPHGPA